MFKYYRYCFDTGSVVMSKKMSDTQMMEALTKFDTATICNVAATYTGSPLCLNLYDQWWGEYYTDTGLHCMYPDMKPVCGYAATAWYSDKLPQYSDVGGFALFDHLDATPKPIVLVAKQSFSNPKLRKLCGLFGGNMTAQFKAFGVQGIVTDGPLRDLEEIRPQKVQYLALGLTSGHGDLQMRAAGIAVKVAGMTVMPGDIVHMDQCGAAKFPARYLPQVLDFATKLLQNEEKQKAVFQDPSFNYQKWKAAQSAPKK
jgi:regulator of RNase E activity RraA